MHPVVERVERQFLPDLERRASLMRERFPALRFNVWHSPTGKLTEHKGYDLGLECLFPAPAEHAPNNVALILELCGVTSTPRLNAEVVWGHPSGYLEATFREGWKSSNDWPEATEKILEELGRDFPKLVRAFQSAVERGAPPIVSEQVDYSGMTVNERLFAAGIVAPWDAAAVARDRTGMIDLLGRVGLADQAAQIVDAILSNPKRYGF